MASQTTRRLKRSPDYQTAFCRSSRDPPFDCRVTISPRASRIDKHIIEDSASSTPSGRRAARIHRWPFVAHLRRAGRRHTIIEERKTSLTVSGSYKRRPRLKETNQKLASSKKQLENIWREMRNMRHGQPLKREADDDVFGEQDKRAKRD